MTDQTEYASVADLVQEVRPYVGQDVELEYHVYTDLTLSADETVTGWAVTWSLFEDPEDATALVVKTVGAGIAVATPVLTVTLTAAVMATLTADTEYYCQLWRTDSGNTYPLTGVSPFTPRRKPPLSA